MHCCRIEIRVKMANSGRLQGGRLARTFSFGNFLCAQLKYRTWQIADLTFIQLPCAGMSTTTGLGVRYGEGKHIIFVNNPEGFAKVSPILCVVLYGTYSSTS